MGLAGRKVIVLLGAVSALATSTPELSNEEKEEFLRTAEVVDQSPVSAGVTGSWRLTLQDDGLTHDAHFQSVDVRRPVKEHPDGRVELNFVDSYRYNIAAYRLARLIGIDHMVPVSVERGFRGEMGALTWWVDDVVMDENEMKERGLKPPDPQAWSEQIYSVRIFNELIHDTDRNRGNILITSDWKIWMIDFTRAFRRDRSLRHPEGLHRVDAQLLKHLQALDRERLEREIGDHLTGTEIEAVLARRDLIVEHYLELIAERGEKRVLY